MRVMAVGVGYEYWVGYVAVEVPVKKNMRIAEEKFQLMN